MRIPSGVTDQYIYFVAVDATDFTSRETGLASFTVYRSRNGGAAAVMTTPTINETDATNMPGVYELLLDEDMTIDSGDDTQEMALHITHAGMAPVTRTIELYRPKITAGNTLDVTATGAAGIDWGNIENKTTANDLSGTDIQLCDTVTTNTDMRGTDSAALASVCTETRLSELDAGTAGKAANQIDIIQTDTTTDIPALIAALNDVSLAQIATEISDSLTVDTFAELSAPPAANAPLRDQLAWIFLLHRNKRTTTATTDTIRNDADSADIGASTISDSAGTFTRGEYA